MKEIDKYAEWVETLWVSKDNKLGEQIAAFGLAGETGEVMELLKKELRDGKWDEENFIKEMGDVIYYWCKVLTYKGIKPSTVLATNITKLEDRKARKVLRGSGDNR